MEGQAGRKEVLLARANWILACIGVPVVLRGLEDCVPSLWVALLEGLLEVRLPGIIREPTPFPVTRHHRIHNIALVLKELADTVLGGVDLSHLSPTALLDREVGQVADLVDLFYELAQQLYPAQARLPSSPGRVMDERELPGGLDDDLSVIGEGRTPDASLQFSNLSPVRQAGLPSPDGLGAATRPQRSPGLEPSVEQPSISLPELSHPSGAGADVGGTSQDAPQHGDSNLTTSSTSRRWRQHPGARKGKVPGFGTEDWMRESDDIEQFVHQQRGQRSPSPSGGVPRTSPRHIAGATGSPRSAPDTPYTRVLKLRRAQLQEDLERTARRTAHLLKPASLRQAATFLLPAATGRRSPGRVPPSTGSQGKGKGAKAPAPVHGVKRKAAGVPGAVLPASGTQRPPKRAQPGRPAPASGASGTRAAGGSTAWEAAGSLSEYNMLRLENRLATTLPTAARAPTALRNVAWNAQVAMWSKALESRLHARKACRAPLAQAAEAAVRAEATVQQELERSASVDSGARASRALGEVRQDLRERERRVVRMTARQEEVEGEVERARVRRRLAEEDGLATIYRTFLAKQRETLVEERKLEREHLLRQRDEVRRRQASRESYYRDQVALYSEKLRACQEEERLAEQAQAQTLRELARESKERARASVRRLKEKLAEDASDHHFQQLDREHLERAIQFRPFRRRSQ